VLSLPSCIYVDLLPHAAVREVDEDGLDAENSPFLKLSVQEAIQAVRDGEEEETVPVETGGGVGRGRPMRGTAEGSRTQL
jgi:hypothetical protein